MLLLLHGIALGTVWPSQPQPYDYTPDDATLQPLILSTTANVDVGFLQQDPAS